MTTTHSASARWPLFFALLAVAALAIMITTAPTAPYALSDWNMTTRESLPLAMKIWLGSMLLTMIASLVFVRRYIAARWVLAAFVVGHTWIALAEGFSLFAVKGGMVSLGHIIVWAPAIYALIANRDQIKLPSAYGLWACAMLFFYSVSLIFDIRDAAIWIAAALGA